MDILTYYAQHSTVTDPGTASERLTDLPTGIDALRRIARGLVIHYRADDPSSHGIPESRLSEIDTRYAEKMLERLFELDEKSLTEKRPPERRILGCCRDYTVLFRALGATLLVLWPLTWAVGSGIGTLQGGFTFGWGVVPGAVVLLAAQIAAVALFARRSVPY